tara:strand:- start:1138 stop:2319 length:1182 start_codon:yes stop_codon:yes gene_type:complete
MTMQTSYCKQMKYSGPESLPPSQASKFDVLINFEGLTGCDHGCVGCFVNKNQDVTTMNSMLETAQLLADGVKRTGLNLREFVVGPTDFFSAENTVNILENPIVQNIMREHTKARIATPSKIDEVSMEKLREIFAILDDPSKYRDEMIIEFIMPIGNIDKILNDEDYFNDIKTKLEFFDKQTPKNIDWSWTLQASNVMQKHLTKENYNKLLYKILNEYETILEMNPAFSRAPSVLHQRNNLVAWNNFLKEVVDQDNYADVTMSMANLYCNSMNFIGLTIIPGYKEPRVFLNVMLHEQAFFTNHPELEVTGLSFEEILAKRDHLIAKGLAKSSKVKDCVDCKYAVACANRLIFQAQDAMNMHECLMPLEVLEMYNPFIDSAEQWNDDALKIVNAS